MVVLRSTAQSDKYWRSWIESIVNSVQLNLLKVKLRTWQTRLTLNGNFLIWTAHGCVIKSCDRWHAHIVMGHRNLIVYYKYDVIKWDCFCIMRERLKKCCRQEFWIYITARKDVFGADKFYLLPKRTKHLEDRELAKLSRVLK